MTWRWGGGGVMGGGGVQVFGYTFCSHQLTFVFHMELLSFQRLLLYFMGRDLTEVKEKVNQNEI